jgi:hypothetical protein
MIDGMARFDKWELLQVIVLPKVAAEPQATNATLPVAFLFAVLTVVTCLQAQGVPFLASGVTGDTSLITAASVQAAVPGTIATIAILGALLHLVWNGLLEQPATRSKAAWTLCIPTTGFNPWHTLTSRCTMLQYSSMLFVLCPPVGRIHILKAAARLQGLTKLATTSQPENTTQR